MKRSICFVFALLGVLSWVGSSANAATEPSAVSTKTLTGIAVDAGWQRQLYAYALENIVHPSWGMAHAERDYQLTQTIARKEKMELDTDVLFVVSFLHDLGAMPALEKKGVDHAVRSVELIEPLLRKWGFPMAKWPAVKDMLLGHNFYGPAPSAPASLAFRDADILDFMGTIGIARILAVTEEAGHPSPVLKPTVDTLREFEKNMAGRCSLQTCKEMAKPRRQEMTDFLRTLDAATFNATVL